MDVTTSPFYVTKAKSTRSTYPKHCLSTYHHKTALVEALKANNVEAACVLVAAQADIHYVDSYGRTVLMYAICDGEKEVEFIKTLLSENASTNSVDKEGLTAVMFAASWGNAEIVTALVSADADANVMDNKGRTALSFAMKGGKTEVVRILVPVDAKLDIMVDHNCSVFSFGLEEVDVEIAERLKTDSHCTEKSDCIVLPDITGGGALYVMQALVIAGAEICTVDGDRKVLRLSVSTRENENANSDSEDNYSFYSY